MEEKLRKNFCYNKDQQTVCVKTQLDLWGRLSVCESSSLSELMVRERGLSLLGVLLPTPWRRPRLVGEQRLD